MLYLLLLTISAFTYVNTSALEGLQERQSGWITGQQVETTSGIVSGHAANNSASVSEYLGIPYGQAPTGSLRFAAPVRFQGQGAVDGSTFVGPILLFFARAVANKRLNRATHVQSD